MSLSLIIGSSGSGKSTHIYNRIIEEAMAHKDKNYLVIVPEQYTMSTQRLLVAMHPHHSIMNIDVLSFNRLAYRIFEELGVGVHSVLDDTGKSLVIRKLVDDNIEKLGALRSNMTRISYITQVKSLISEMTQYNITPEKLKEMIALPIMSESFRRKASDLLVMYEAFLEFIDGKFVTTESILSTLNTVIDSSEIVNGSTIVLDGFTGFTPIQYQLVEHMLQLSDEVAVTITQDISVPIFEKAPDDALFAMSSEFAIKMSLIAKRAQVEINEPVLIDAGKGWLSNSAVLSHLEQNIFRDKYNKYRGEASANEAIGIYSLRSLRDELTFTAIQIEKLIRNGYHYKDIAIVCPNLESYRYLVAGIFSEYKIPYFVDAKTEILFHPFVEAVDAVFDIFENQFRREDVFRFLRSGLCNIPVEDIDYLENYILSTGIKGKKKYFHPFAIRSNSYSEDADLLRVNQIREGFIGPFIKMDKAIKKDSSVREIAMALYDLIISFNCEAQIKTRQLMHEELGHAVVAKEYSQIYTVIMDILDKMVGILDDEIIPLEQFHEIYKAGLSAASIGVIPPANDSVILGDIERTRLSNVKVLFCLGASDDAIPMKVENGGILSQLEREQLLDAGFEMAPSDRQKAFRQRFYLYLMLTKPSEKLFITYPRVDAAGKGVNKSYLVDLLLRLFPDLTVKELDDFSVSDRLLSNKSALNYLIELINTMATYGADSLNGSQQADLQKLLAWAKNDSNIDLDKIIGAAFYEHRSETVSEDIMLAVNEAFHEDETVSGSVSKFETYSECAYRYFLTYILRLKEREEFQLSSIDMGNFYHDALERYSNSLKEDNLKWSTISEELSDAHIEAAIAQTFESMAKVATLEDATQKYIVETMKKTLKYTITVITEQVKRGEFEPELFEEGVRTVIRDYESKEVVANLVGKVDRIDLTEGNDRAVRIIDYKSSGHKMDLNECYHGLSLQLPIYMGVVLEKLKEKYPNVALHPSAMLYYETANKFLELENGDESGVAEKRLRLNRMEGLLSSDEDDLKANDATVGIEDGQSKKSSIVPYSVNKDGEIDRNTNAVSRDDLGVVIDYAYLTAANIAKDIIDGKFDCSPARLGNIDACRYCDFKSVCHFDETKDGFVARDLDKLGSREDIIEKMKESLEESKGDIDSGAH
ncbi:MAG: exodeoxyribonuclease V subunit gamma [Pseudobutyrivibrio sp.]|nr:exodeoxyribonuclease V subunit gamma [Pseudobutyrivibrio sp.]